MPGTQIFELNGKDASPMDVKVGLTTRPEPDVTTPGSLHLPERDFPFRHELSSEVVIHCARPGLLSGRAQGLLEAVPSLTGLHFRSMSGGHVILREVCRGVATDFERAMGKDLASQVLLCIIFISD